MGLSSKLYFHIPDPSNNTKIFHSADSLDVMLISSGCQVHESSIGYKCISKELSCDLRDFFWGGTFFIIAPINLWHNVYKVQQLLDLCEVIITN